MKIKTPNEEPYGDLICSHVNQSFPKVAVFTEGEIIDALTNIIVGTKEIRYGCLPSPESLVIIRDVIRTSIEKNVPIPILVPWGSMKVSGLDVAELSAINRLINTNDLVSEYYTPGLEIVIRVEDLSGYELFKPDFDNELVILAIDSYCSSFEKLVNILAGFTIKVIKETNMDNADEFVHNQNALLPFFERYIEESEQTVEDTPNNVVFLASYKELEELGWKGFINRTQRDYYYDCYNKLYPDNTLEKNIKRLSLYLAQSLARHRLNLSGKQDHWNQYIQLTFVPPIKGLPKGYHSNCVYYRTIPLSHGRTHIAPWRSRGYLKINGNTIQHKITNLNDPILKELTPVRMQISNNEGNISVTINADYYLEA